MKKALLLPLVLMIGSCATTTPEIHLPPINTNRPAPVPKVEPTPMNLTHVEWKVYTAAELKAELDRSAPDTVFYVLTPNEFRNLTMNVTEMKRFIEDQRDINQALIAAIEVNTNQ